MSKWRRKGGGSGQCVACGRRRGGGPASGKCTGGAEVASGWWDRGPVCVSIGHCTCGPAGYGLPGWLGEKGTARLEKNMTLFYLFE
jgi:hypothetical protein